MKKEGTMKSGTVDKWDNMGRSQMEEAAYSKRIPLLGKYACLAGLAVVVMLVTAIHAEEVVLSAKEAEAILTKLKIAMPIIKNSQETDPIIGGDFTSIDAIELSDGTVLTSGEKFEQLKKAAYEVAVGSAKEDSLTIQTKHGNGLRFPCARFAEIDKVNIVHGIGIFSGMELVKSSDGHWESYYLHVENNRSEFRKSAETKAVASCVQKEVKDGHTHRLSIGMSTAVSTSALRYYALREFSYLCNVPLEDVTKAFHDAELKPHGKLWIEAEIERNENGSYYYVPSGGRSNLSNNKK
jgi:hypothetical protein